MRRFMNIRSTLLTATNCRHSHNLIRGQQLNRRRFKRSSHFEERNDRWVSLASLEIRYVLLRKAGQLGKLLLREASCLTQAAHIPAD